MPIPIPTPTRTLIRAPIPVRHPLPRRPPLCASPHASRGVFRGAFRDTRLVPAIAPKVAPTVAPGFPRVIAPVIALGLAVALIVAVIVATPQPAAAFFGGGGVSSVVFDPSNYAKNLLTAIRTLNIIENQASQLANEARHLLSLSGSAGDLVTPLEDIGRLVNEGGAPLNNANAAGSYYDRVHPESYGAATTAARIAADAQTRRTQSWQARRAAFRVQAGIASGITRDTNTLETALSASRNAAGNLQGIQAGNRINALSVKQSLQLQGLLASQARAETLRRARIGAERARGQAHLRRFLSGGPAYTP